MKYAINLNGVPIRRPELLWMAATRFVLANPGPETRGMGFAYFRAVMIRARQLDKTFR